MKKEKFLEKLESLLEFNHKSKFIMYSHDLKVTYSDLFFYFSITDNGMSGCIQYSDILDVSLKNDSTKGLYMHLVLTNGSLYIPASGFDVKTGAPVHNAELYQEFKRAWIIQELNENQVMKQTVPSVQYFLSYSEDVVSICNLPLEKLLY